MSRAVAAWLVVLAAGAGTYAIRLSFLAVAHRAPDVPYAVRMVLRMIPAAALGALTVPAVLRPEATIIWFGPRPVAALLAGVVAWKTRNLALTIAVGIIAVLIAQPLFG